MKLGSACHMDTTARCILTMGLDGSVGTDESIFLCARLIFSVSVARFRLSIEFVTCLVSSLTLGALL